MGRTLRREEVQLIFDAISSVHHGGPPDGVELCPLAVRLALFAPQRVASMAAMGSELAEPIRRGREVFAELAPPEIVAAVHRSLADPQPLATAMSVAGTTLLHGDLWLVNLALDGPVVTPLDWGLATQGPPALDLVSFCVGATSNVDVGRHELLELARRSCGRFRDPAVFAVAEFWALMELGWNKALDAADHPDPAQRGRAAADLDFWVARARAALEAGLVP